MIGVGTYLILQALNGVIGTFASDAVKTHLGLLGWLIRTNPPTTQLVYFVGLALGAGLVVYGAIETHGGARAGPTLGRSVESVASGTNTRATSSKAAPETSQAEVTPIAPDRAKLFLPENITPLYLTRLLEDHTKIQADKLLSVYLGQWLSVAGVVVNIYDNGTTLHVFLKRFPEEGIWVSAKFEKARWLHVAGIPKGSVIKINGELLEVRERQIMLAECELVEDKGTDRAEILGGSASV